MTDRLAAADTCRAAPAWRPATHDDLPVFMAVQKVAHPLLQESRAVMANKLDLYPEGCRILMLDGLPVAYAIAHPWRLGQVPPLDTVLAALPEEPDSLYIHDVALLPPARQKGAAHAFVALARDLARRRGWNTLALVSVYGTSPIWERCGFRTVPLPGLEAKFGPFGATARYMTASVDAPPPG